MTRPAFGAAAAMVLAGFGIAVFGYTHAPSGGQVPIHWDAAGHVNGWGSASSFFIQPAIAAAATLLLAVVPYIDPRRGRALGSMAIYPVVVLGINALFLGIEILTVNAALSGSTPLTAHLILAAVGVLFIALAFFMPSVKSNWFVGIRTPWTLSSESAWRKTHQVGAWTFGAGGLVIVASAFMSPQAALWLLIVAVVVAGGVPFVYSYFAWRDAPDKAGLASTP